MQEMEREREREREREGGREAGRKRKREGGRGSGRKGEGGGGGLAPSWLLRCPSHGRHTLNPNPSRLEFWVGG